jgi:hypothetical protein
MRQLNWVRSAGFRAQLYWIREVSWDDKVRRVRIRLTSSTQCRQRGTHNLHVWASDSFHILEARLGGRGVIRTVSCLIIADIFIFR